jgi:manganese/zinc/iron transport system substrate-binding protein
MISPDKILRFLTQFLRVMAFAVALFTPVGCSRPTADVVATTGMIADAASRIGGDRVRVEGLMGPGVDPHRFQPSAGDLGKLYSAKLVLFNGLHLEGKMSELLEQSKNGRAVTKNLDPKRLRPADTDGGAHDPHVWFDVTLWSECVATIRDEMIQTFPQHADAFRANADAYLKELAALDTEVREKANRLPESRRILVTSHDAFGYFADAYGFKVRGLQGVSTAAESGTKDVDDLAEFIGKHRVPAVFLETSVPTQGLQQVLDTVRKRHPNHIVKLLGDADALFSDALGEPGTLGGTYVGMVRHNIDGIVKALAP